MRRRGKDFEIVLKMEYLSSLRAGGGLDDAPRQLRPQRTRSMVGAMLMKLMLRYPSPTTRNVAAKLLAAWRFGGAVALGSLITVAASKALLEFALTPMQPILGIGLGAFLLGLNWFAVAGISATVTGITAALMVRRNRVMVLTHDFETAPQKSSKLPDSVIASRKAVVEGKVNDDDAGASPAPCWLLDCEQVLNFYQEMAAGIRRGELDEPHLYESVRRSFCQAVTELAPVIRTKRARSAWKDDFEAVTALYDAWRRPDMPKFKELPVVQKSLSAVEPSAMLTHETVSSEAATALVAPASEAVSVTR